MFGEGGKLIPGKYNCSVFLIPDPKNKERAAAEEHDASMLLGDFSNSSSGGIRLLSRSKPDEAAALDKIEEEAPRGFGDAPSEVLSMLDGGLNPSVWNAWHIRPQDAARFERMYDKRVAGVIQPTTLEMNLYLARLTHQYEFQKKKWNARWGSEEKIDVERFDAEVSQEEQMENPFLMEENDQVYMQQPWEVANDLYDSSKMYRMIDGLTKGTKPSQLPFTFTKNSLAI